MIRVASVLAFTLVFSGADAYAQAKAEIFAGYSFQRAAPCGVSGSGCNFEHNEGPLTGNFSGWEAALTGYWKTSLGVTADFSGHYGSSSLTSFSSSPGASVRFSSYGYLFGPTYAPRQRQFTPFVHGLVGGVSWRSNLTRYSGLAWAIGGGLDIKAWQHFAVRIAQLDYVGNRAPNGINASSWRYSFGLVFAF